MFKRMDTTVYLAVFFAAVAVYYANEGRPASAVLSLAIAIGSLIYGYRRRHQG